MENKQAGKGDSYRPVKKSQYNQNYDSINWGKPNNKVNNPKQVSIIKPLITSEV